MYYILSVFILFISTRESEATVDRRFSDLKRCADEECSMLLCRGKASQDFVGPDCRFLSFKAGETIYVYYKLSGQRSDVWAGSVGNSFGYFPKDFLNINHIYTEKEIEVSTEETDFVCFDTGVDKFASYDVDALLQNSFIDQINEPSDKSEESDASDEDGETEEPSRDVALNPDSSRTGGQDDDPETSRAAMEMTASSEKDQDQDIVSESDPDRYVDQDEPSASPSVNDKASEESNRTTQVENVSELKTTLGTTFDAVATDDESTRKVTPYDDDEDLREGLVPHVVEEHVKEPSLLTFEQKSLDVPEETKDEHVQKEEPSPENRDTDETRRDVFVNSDSSPTEGEAEHGNEREGLPRDPELAPVLKVTTTSDEKDEHRAETIADPEQPVDRDVPDEASSSPSKDDEGLEDGVRTTEVETVVSEARTTFGTTFEAVTTDDENTIKVTPEDDEAWEDDLVQQVVEEEPVKEPSLLTFDEQPQDVKDESVWSTLGDRVFKIVSGGERVDETKDNDEEEDEEEEEEEEVEVEEKREEKMDAETKPKAEPVFQDISISDIKTSEEVEEQNVNVSNNNNESEEIKGVASDLDENLVSSESEAEPQHVPQSSLLEKNPNPSETKFHKPETFIEEDSPKGPELEEHTEEQIQRVKHTIIDLFEDTLKSENLTSEPQIDEDEDQDPEELLQDENAVLATRSDTAQVSEEPVLENPELEPVEEEKNDLVTLKEDELEDDEKMEQDEEPEAIEETRTGPLVEEEPEYSESVQRLTLLRDHFNDDEIGRMLRHLSIKDLYKVEAMFTDLDHRLNAAKQAHPNSSEDLEHALESILEVSENAILDEIDGMLDAREKKALQFGQQMDQSVLDEESAVLDDFQEFAFYLHQKYSSSVPLVKEENLSHVDTAENVSDVSEASEEVGSPTESPALTDATESPELHQETADLFTVIPQDDEPQSQDATPPEEDAGRFNENHQDVQASFQEATEIPKGPQAILETPLDVLGFEINPSSDPQDSSKTSDFAGNNEQASASDHVRDSYLLTSDVFGVYVEIIDTSETVMESDISHMSALSGVLELWTTVSVVFVSGFQELIAAMPEDWRPGPTFYGLPWKPIVVTAVVGVLTVLVFLWRTVLAVKSRRYLLTEKQLGEKIQQLISEKSEVLQKVSELNKTIKQHEEKLSNSEESRSSQQEEFLKLKANFKLLFSLCVFQNNYRDLNEQKEKLSSNFARLYEKIANAEKENKTLNEKISTMHEGVQKYQETLKKYDEDRSKVQVLVDEAKLREDALKAQVLSFEKDNCALKEQKKSLLQDAKDWQEKHVRLSEEIKVYHKTQTELENALVHKENEIEVLSGCIAELKSLEACNNEELGNDKNEDPLKLHLKQMMDVSRIKATLSVIEDERNRWFENFMAEQKVRQELEEKYQKVVHDQTNIKNEKTHLENQYKNLQQRLEITTELYHQKENILHQKLTQEELERHEKESKLSEVDGRALQAEEELNLLRQKVKDMQEEMQQNERSLKAEIAVQEKKAHENWLKARASERTLIEEKRECANLRQKIVEFSDKMSDLERSLCRSGDSYGPSPVSGGAPSPPLMIEGPGRPPSGRRSETFGPRLLLDGHGRSSDLGHPLPFRPDMSGPRTSSPHTQDGSVNKSQRQGSFLPSPIRDSPVPGSNALPKAFGPPPMGGPLPPPMPPPNGHYQPMIPPGPPFGPDPRFRPPHMDSYRPPFPLRPYGPVPPRPFVTEKQCVEKIQQLINEKSEVLQKVSKLNKTIKQHEEKVSNSEESRRSLQTEILELKACVRKKK
ncbi:melanoma inhibitory activity protein 3 isoform X3 [Silurus asotus]|uniref:Transport and Golgi organization protein 1 homolog n=1 Tax=Silurus asotus TaxID=30991 RepID=A0AAD5FT63_SILAS|nr:melanoma inhibitory activity protein 3 isoform X3 [Silurus asotus]